MSFAAWRINKGRLEAQILLYAFMRHIFAGVSLFEQAQICSQPSSLHQRASKASKASKARVKNRFPVPGSLMSCQGDETESEALNSGTQTNTGSNLALAKSRKIDAKQFESEFKQKSQI